MPEPKAREFWIKEHPTARTTCGAKLYDAFDKQTETGKIHVIEYSAYEAVIKSIMETGTQYQNIADQLEDQRHAYNELKKQLGEERAKVATLVEALQKCAEQAVNTEPPSVTTIVVETLAKIKGES